MLVSYGILVSFSIVGLIATLSRPRLELLIRPARVISLPTNCPDDSFPLLPRRWPSEELRSGDPIFAVEVDPVLFDVDVDTTISPASREFDRSGLSLGGGGGIARC